MEEQLESLVELLGILVERLENLNAELRYCNEQLEEIRKAAE
jgi:hypothetical protein